MIKLICVAVIAILSISCNSLQTKKDVENKKNDVTDTLSISKNKPETALNIPSISEDTTNVQVGNELHLAFKADVDSLTIKCYIDSALKPLFCYVRIEKGRQLTIALDATKGKGNIRINQITSPKNKSDGPFGQIVDYQLKQMGVYKITIGSSLMADDPFTGDLLLHLALK